MKSVYLAGPIQHAEGHGVNWRQQVMDDYDEDFEWLDPLSKYDTSNPEVEFFYEDDLPDEEVYELKTQVTSDGEPKYVSPTDIVEGDKRIIDRSDAILVGWSEVPSCGTPMEVMYQYMLNELHPHRDHVPIVVWWMDGDDLEKTLSPWMEYHTDYVTYDRQDAVDDLRFALDYQDAQKGRTQPRDVVEGAQ